jgi:hypothetical protein
METLTSIKNKVLQLQGVLMRVSSLADGGLSVLFHTNEMSPEEKVEMMQEHGKFGWMLFSESVIQPVDIPRQDPDLEGKTPSKRLRNVIFVLWRQMKDAKKTQMNFEDFYRGQIESLIDKYKEKLEPSETMGYEE